MITFLHIIIKRFVPKENKFINMLKNLSKRFLSAIFVNGVKFRIGKKHKIKMDIRFVHYQNFGRGHNNGWATCLDYCRNKQCFIDIGAHIGLYSIPASKLLAESGKVIAFEPATANFNTLLRHIKMNNSNNINAYNYLIGEKEDYVVFHEDITDVNPMNSIVSNYLKKGYIKNYKKQHSLDSFCKTNFLKPDVIKIDVEGSEINVLKGARALLVQSKPYIFLSVHPKHIKMMGYSINDLYEVITSLRYEIKNIDGSDPGYLYLNEYLLVPNKS